MTTDKAVETSLETQITVVKALLRCGGRMTIDSLPDDPSMASYNIPATVQEAIAAALEANARLRAALEAIAGIGFDAPAAWAGTDEAWERSRANKMQLMARTALKGDHNDN